MSDLRRVLPGVLAVALASAACNGVKSELERGFSHRYDILPGRTAVFWRTPSEVQGAGVSAVSLEDGAGEVIRVRTVEDVRRSGVRIRTGEDALAYSEMLRDFHLLREAPGQPLRPAGTGAPAPRTFTPADAERWRLAEEVEVSVAEGGFLLRRPVVLPSGFAAFLEGESAEPVVVLALERVSSDGAYDFQPVRVLERGDHVIRFAVLLP